MRIGFQNVEPLASFMADSKSLPHDRGHLLWTADEGPSRMLLSSMDRWINTVNLSICPFIHSEAMLPDQKMRREH